MAKLFDRWIRSPAIEALLSLFKRRLKGTVPPEPAPPSTATEGVASRRNGKIHVTWLATGITDKCNLRCYHCSTQSPYLHVVSDYHPPVDEFRKNCQDLASVLESGNIEIVGGEPLLTPDLAGFVRAAKETGLSRKATITSNGLLLHKMSDELWELLDLVRISLYPDTAARLEGRMERIRALADSFGTELQVEPFNDFAPMLFDEPIPDDDLVREIFLRCEEAHKASWPCISVENGRLYRCSRIGPADRYLTAMGIEHPPFIEIDGLLIDSRPTLGKEVWRQPPRIASLDCPPR